jgi:DHA1 family bicyclomycin/chloramphenicol resistance-like MFS transporter
MSPALIVLVLSLLLGIQPITTDLYLPALPALTEGFAAPMAQAQLTLTGLLLAFGVSQLFWGPLSDRFGRRPILLCGLGAYVLAAIGAASCKARPWARRSCARAPLCVTSTRRWPVHAPCPAA